MNGPHSEVVWAGLGRIGFNADVDGCSVKVEVLVEVVDVVFFGSGVVVVLVKNGGLFQFLGTITDVWLFSRCGCIGHTKNEKARISFTPRSIDSHKASTDENVHTWRAARIRGALKGCED